jgi:protein CpxP
MKLKSTELIVIFLSLISVFTTACQSSRTPTASVKQIQTENGGTKNNWSGLQLSEEQKTKFQEIRNHTRSQIEAILTPLQKQQFQAAIAQGKNLQQATKKLNLSTEQQQKIREIVRSQRQEFSQLLTAQQKQQLQQRHLGKR